MHIAIVYSKPSRRLIGTEYEEADDDSAVIANEVAWGLKFKKYEVSFHPVEQDHIDVIGEIKADCIFNLIEWCGMDIELSQKAFKYMRALNVPVTGSSEELFVLTGDKIRMKKTLQKLGVPTPFGIPFKTGKEKIPVKLKYPMIVKPSLEHCSMGLSQDSIAHDPGELRTIALRQIKEFEQPALAETFIPGRELLVYMIEEKGKPRVLPIEEILFYSKNPLAFQTFEAKWVEGHEDYKSTGVDLAKLNDDQQKMIEEVCVKAFKEMKFRGYARFDIRYLDDTPFILETNANPSVFDAEAEIPEEKINQEIVYGIKFPDYLETIVKAAFYHHNRGEKI